MKKEETIAKYGEESYEKVLAQNRAWAKAHREEMKVYKRKYAEEHQEQVIANKKKYKEEHPEELAANNHEISRKGGKYYNKQLEYMRTGIPGERHRIRSKHAKEWKLYKAIISPESQIHHEWIPKTSKYRGVALVEAEPHMYGIIDVIQILDGKITLLTEEEIIKEEMEKENENR